MSDHDHDHQSVTAGSLRLPEGGPVPEGGDAVPEGGDPVPEGGEWQSADRPERPDQTSPQWSLADNRLSRRTSERTAASRRGPSPVMQAVITMLMLAATLAAARFLVPTIIEESRYAWRRGQLRAEYEGSDGALHNIGLEAISSAYQMVTQRVGPSVVHIEVVRAQPDSQQTLNAIGHGRVLPPEMSDQGSGVIVDASGTDGLILTNYHVIAEGNRITVGLSDGRRVAATVVGSDPLSDLALLQIHAENLLPVEWGDSDSAEVGTPVWAVGSPFGLDHTVTFGILSGKHRVAKAMVSLERRHDGPRGPGERGPRHEEINHRYQDFMQSDVAVNPGSSGGPLVDARGRLIGINTMIVGEWYRGVSFSIPSNVARRVFERLKETGRFDRGWLGVVLADVPDEMVQGGNYRMRGALVQRLIGRDSPAALAGMSPGDIILRFDGEQVADVGALMRMIGNRSAGQTVDVELLRDGHHHSVSVDIGDRPAADTAR